MMPRAKSNKMCSNCIYGVIRENVEVNAPNVVCMKKSKLEKCRVLLVQEDCKCRDWKDAGDERKRNMEEVQNNETD